VQGNYQKSVKAGSSIRRNEGDERIHRKRGTYSHNKYGFS